jgi:hypothetical protein
MMLFSPANVREPTTYVSHRNETKTARWPRTIGLDRINKRPPAALSLVRIACDFCLSLPA